MTRYIPTIAWVLVLYAVTAITAGKAVVPLVAPSATAEQIRQAWFLFELKHVLMHAAAYAGLAWLLMLPHPARGAQRLVRIGIVAFFIAFAVGVGQEIIQTVIRWEIRLGNSSLDILSNSAGAALGLFVWHSGFLHRRDSPGGRISA